MSASQRREDDINIFWCSDRVVSWEAAIYNFSPVQA